MVVRNSTRELRIIDKTINGKLDEEGKLGANVFRTSKTRYDNILKTIAAKIYTSAFDEAFELNKFKSEFNTNEHNYCVLKQQIFTNNVSCKTENESKDIDEEKFRINILNSYFFVETEKYCKFKDDNILFFLTSKIIVDLLTKLSKEEGKDEQIAIIREIGSYYLHPIFIDNTEGILRNYSKTNEKEIDTIYSALYSLIHNGLIININSVNTYLTFDYTQIKANVFLGILFMTVNTKTYKDGNDLSKYYFNRLYWYISGIKTYNNNYYNVFKRAFRNKTIIGADFNRLNLSGYNFSNTKLIDCNINQTKLFDTTFDGTKFNNVKFMLSNFSKIEYKNIEGEQESTMCEYKKIKFSNCICKLSYINCKFDQITFNKFSSDGKVNLIFKDSFVSNVKFDHCSSGKLYLYFENCKVSNIEVIGDDVHVRDVGSNFKNIGNAKVMRWDFER